MRISRREALSVSGTFLTGLAVGLKPELVQARQEPQYQDEHWAKAVENFESPDIKVGRSSANRHNLRGVSSPSVIE